MAIEMAKISQSNGVAANRKLSAANENGYQYNES
jgi:hypothetical protein